MKRTPIRAKRVGGLGSPGEKPCAACGEPFEPRRSRLGWTIYCSHACSGIGRSKRSTATCVICGVSFETGGRAGSRKTCGSVECVGEAKSRAVRRRDPEIVARGARTSAARRAALNVDMPAGPRVCARPGCARPVESNREYCSRRCHYDDRQSPGRGRKQEQAYHRCAVCREVFAWKGTGKGACCSGACRRALKTIPAPVEVVEVVALRYSKEVWFAISLGACSQTGCDKRAQQRHHVVYAQHVVRESGDVWHPDNALILCVSSHAKTHQGRLELTDLRDENYRFAVDLLGAPRAYEYLKRRYAGADPRLDELIA